MDTRQQGAARMRQMASVPVGTVQRCGGHTCPPGTCGHHDDEWAVLRRDPDPIFGVLGGRTVPESVRAVLRGPGQRLEPAVRSRMEGCLGWDLGSVRVHTDSAAGRSAVEIGALAYTVGNHVAFAENQFRPGTQAGSKLLVHELAHVVQQDGALPPDGALRLGDPHDGHEREADAVSAAAPRSTRGDLPGTIRRQSDPDRAAPTVQPWPMMVFPVDHPAELEAQQIESTSGRSDHLDLSRIPAHSVARQSNVDASGSRHVEFHPGVIHNHAASGKWRDVREAPNSGFWVGLACANLDPSDVIAVAISHELGDKPIAREHVEWYLAEGDGADYDENGNLALMLQAEVSLQRAIYKQIPFGRDSGTAQFYISVTQSLYGNQDLRFALGAIDRMDVEVDFSAGTVRAWFQDRYEWHPFYPSYSRFPDDVLRDSNCVHAAFVEMKNLGFAKDFWMKGEATVPLSVIRSSVKKAGGAGRDRL
ncbi:DUF4157 domain-containing protein [Streptomyces sp. NPDC050400]|uniref:DUF4157 domain-containing protein n=1 Tax=Streptomyces sp. NPDC050400 TaxID=3365610 RepID=UPI003798A7D2